MNIGIHGIGVYLPDQIRCNDWWPASIVDKWREKKARSFARTETTADELLTEGARITLSAMRAVGADPFEGSRERRVLPEPIPPSHMEIAAARDAIERSGVDSKQIDLVLSFSICPDFLGEPTGCAVHQALGLSESCQTVAVDSVCNSFISQLCLAEAMIRAGRSRFALLTQTCLLSRLAPIEEPYSAWFGDAATAVVIGPVAEGFGLLGASHRTDGNLQGALVTGVPGGRWYDGGKMISYSENPSNARTMILGLVERGKQVVDDALANSQLSRQDVSFYASHQATIWFRKVTQEFFQLGHAKSVDTFPFATSVSAANVPLVLAMGEREGTLARGDVVATYTGGTGITFSSAILRWGT